MIIKHVRYMLVSDVTAQYLTFTNDEPHLCGDVGKSWKATKTELYELIL